MEAQDIELSILKIMKQPEAITKTELLLEKTISLKKLLGKNVISKGGKIIGQIVELRVNPKGFELEGILIKREIGETPLYIGKSYFALLSEDAIILNIEVSLLIKNKTVIDSEGRIIGHVKEVSREGTKNNLRGIYAKKLFKKKFFIPASAIENVSKSVILKPDYNARKKYIEQKNS